MPFIDNTNAPRFVIDGASFASVAAPSRGSRESAVWRTTVAPNTVGLEHHLTREEIIVALSGSGVVHIGDEQHPLAAGDAFVVPAFTDFRLGCAGEDAFEAITVIPAGGRAVVEGKPAFSPPWTA